MPRVGRWVSAEKKLPVRSCRRGRLEGRSVPQPARARHVPGGRGPARPLVGCRWPPGHARGTDTRGNEGDFGGLEETAPVKGRWVPDGWSRAGRCGLPGPGGKMAQG